VGFERLRQDRHPVHERNERAFRAVQVAADSHRFEAPGSFGNIASCERPGRSLQRVGGKLQLRRITRFYSL